MPFVPAQNCARFSVEQTVAGEKAANVFWVQDQAGWTLGKLATAAGVFEYAWDSNLKTLLAGDWQLDKVVAQDFTTYNGVSTEHTPSPAIVGSGAGDTLPPQNALVVSWRTQARGRSFRGRTYLCGLTEFYQDNGRMGSTVLVGVSTWADYIIATFGTANQALGVVSFETNKSPRQAGLFTPYATHRCNGVIYTQRRRTISVA